MRQMVLDLPLSYPQHLRQLMGGQASAGQEIDDALALGALGRQHGVMVGERAVKSQTSRPCPLLVTLIS